MNSDINEHDGVEQQFQHRQSTMKKEKKSSKTENRFKSKLESLKKFPHTTSANNAFERARAFFRSLDFKHHHRHEQLDQFPTTDLPSSDEDQQKKDLLLNPIPSTTNISPTKISQVEKINPQDLIVHRVVHNDNKLPSNYFQQKYKQYLKPSLLIPKQYYNDILNKRYENYFAFINKHDFYPHSFVSTLSSDLTSSITHNEISSDHFRSFNYHEIESSSSMLKWNQCVRRLNTEYRLTINALQQAKECLEQVYSNTKKISEKKDFTNNQTKKISNVTFSLPTLDVSTNKIHSSIQFSKPKLVKPVQLNTFVSSIKLEPLLSIVEKDEKFDSITNIIQKFNNLSCSINKEQSSLLTNENDQIENSLQEEETTYTVDTIYKTTDHLVSLNNEHILIVQENTTEEQFHLAQQEINTTSPVLVNNNNQISSSSIILKNNNKSISLIPKRITTTTTANLSPLKQPSKMIASSSKIKPPSSTTSIRNIKTQVQVQYQRNTHLVQASFPTKKQSVINSNQPDSISSNRVKSIVHQINANASTTNKRPSRPISIQHTTSTNRNTIERK